MSVAPPRTVLPVPLSSVVVSELGSSNLTEERENELLDELNRLEGPNPFGGDPCVWEFEQGEDLYTFGFFSMFFDTPDVEYDVSWSIFGNGVSEVLSGGINADGPIAAPDPNFQIGQGWVTLDAPAPAGLLPGDYGIRVSVGLSSNSGSFFWESSEPFDRVELTEICQDNPEFDAFYNDDSNFDDNGDILPGLVEPPFEICGYNSVNIDAFDDPIVPARTFFSSDTEILRILPASVGEETEVAVVPTPSTFATMFAGLLLLVSRRRQRS